MDFKRVKIITTSPVENANDIRAALSQAGTGKMGEYGDCSFTVLGKGRFTPTPGADPHIGEANKLEIVEEEQINVMCDRSQAKHVIAELRRVHPYEEPLIEIIPLIDEQDL
jgi:hypothetical protein